MANDGDMLDASMRPRLASRARLLTDRVTGKPVLLFPEGVLALNKSGVAIAELCDGALTLDEIVSTLESRFGAPNLRPDVTRFLTRLSDRGLLQTGPDIRNSTSSPLSPPFPGGERGWGRGVSGASGNALGAQRPQYRPLGLLAELTYTCPLRCPYCSNPTSYPQGRSELTTAEWQRVLTEAVDLGVLHVLFSGGEPLLRPDLPELIATARAAGVYTNLITSAIGFTPDRARAIKDAGLDSIQISFQADEADLGDLVAGARVHARKREAARLARDLDLPLTINVVMHRRNIGRLASMVALAEEFGAERLELANVQFYGWAFRNKEGLLPTRAQLMEAEKTAAEAQTRLRGRMEVHYILPDYYGDRPKPCMNGWGQRYLTVNPVGDVLPCPTASEIDGITFANVRDHSLNWIWEESDAFNRFRGTEWMTEPCQTCDMRDIDFGGCRCQAALLTGNAAIADPACSLSPHHADLKAIVEGVQNATPSEWNYRINPVKA